MCVICVNCNCDENELIESFCFWEEIWYDTKCPECKFYGAYDYVRHPDCNINQCPKCASETELFNNEAYFSKNLKKLTLHVKCDKCEHKFKIKYIQSSAVAEEG